MKKIIVPVDFSDNSIIAVNLAINIAKSRNTEIKLVHINTFLAEPGLNVDTAMKILNEHKNEMQVAMNKIKKLFKDTDIKVTSLIEMDAFVSQGVADAAEDYDADFIIMGTLGSSSNVIKKIIGSNTLSVVDQTKVPVLIVPPNIDNDYNIKSILIVSDASTNTALLLDKVKKMAKFLDVNMKILSLQTYKEYVPLSNSYLNISVDYIVPSESIVDTLNTYIKTSTPESLIAMHTHKRSFFEGLWDAGKINNLVDNANFPILLYNYQ